MSPVNIVDITYTVVRNQNNHLLFISDECLQGLHLPYEVKDELASFGAEVGLQWPHDSVQLSIVARLSSILRKYWSLEYGVPRFRFIGDTEKLGDELRHRAALIFIRFDGISSEDLLEIYSDVVSQCSKLVFFTDRFASTDHKAIQTYLRQQRYEQHMAQAKKLHADFTARMSSWYTDTELRNLITNDAQVAIETFITKKSLDIFIPNFLVVPVYHIRRYQKAVELINEVYMPDFIMSLPLVVADKGYTVLFPISHKNRGKK